MEIQPLKTIHEPNYPQRENVSAAHLKTSIPKRWTNTAGKFALGVLALFLLSGCRDESAAKPAPTQKPTNTPICTWREDGDKDIIIVDGKEVEVHLILNDGVPAPPKINTFFRNIVDSISDLFDGND